jgi:hypothetical protein
MWHVEYCAVEFGMWYVPCGMWNIVRSQFWSMFGAVAFWSGGVGAVALWSNFDLVAFVGKCDRNLKELSKYNLT